MTCEFEKSLTAYALGELDAETIPSVSSHLEKCQSCAKSLQALQNSLSQFNSIPVVKPSNLRRKKALMAVGNSGGKVRVMRIIAAVAAVAVVLTVGFVYMNRTKTVEERTLSVVETDGIVSISKAGDEMRVKTYRGGYARFEISGKEGRCSVEVAPDSYVAIGKYGLAVDAGKAFVSSAGLQYTALGPGGESADFNRQSNAELEVALLNIRRQGSGNMSVAEAAAAIGKLTGKRCNVSPLMTDDRVAISSIGSVDEIVRALDRDGFVLLKVGDDYEVQAVLSDKNTKPALLVKVVAGEVPFRSPAGSVVLRTGSAGSIADRVRTCPLPQGYDASWRSTSERQLLASRTVPFSPINVVVERGMNQIEIKSGRMVLQANGKSYVITLDGATAALPANGSTTIPLKVEVQEK